MCPIGLLINVQVHCNAPGVVGVESDAGNRECNAVLFNAQTHHRVLTTITAPNTGDEKCTTEIHDQEQTRSSTTEPKVTRIYPAQKTGESAV